MFALLGCFVLGGGGRIWVAFKLSEDHMESCFAVSSFVGFGLHLQLFLKQLM